MTGTLLRSGVASASDVTRISGACIHSPFCGRNAATTLSSSRSQREAGEALSNSSRVDSNRHIRGRNASLGWMP
jgi:hypothetical protein